MPTSSTCGISLTLNILIIAHATAATLDVNSRVEAQSRFGPHIVLSGPGTDEARSVGRGIASTGGVFEGVAIAETGSNPRTVANAIAGSLSLAVPFGSTLAGAFGQTSALAELTYDVGLPQTRQLPVGFVIAYLPVKVNVKARVEADVQGQWPSSAAAAFASGRIGGFPVPTISAISSAGVRTDQFNRDFAFSFVPGSVVQVYLRAEAGSAAGSGGSIAKSNTTALAVIDPVFSFDQPAFDEFAWLQGFPTFNLNDYYAFETSPLLRSEVPEPSTGALFTLGVVALLAGRYRQKLSPQNPQEIARLLHVRTLARLESGKGTLQ